MKKNAFYGCDGVFDDDNHWILNDVKHTDFSNASDVCVEDTGAYGVMMCDAVFS